MFGRESGCSSMWSVSPNSGDEMGVGCEEDYFTARLCSPINMKSPARTLVGVKPRIR